MPSMGPNLSGTFLFEFDSQPWGNIVRTRNSYGYWGGDRASLEIKNIYFDFRGAVHSYSDHCKDW